MGTGKKITVERVQAHNRRLEFQVEHLQKHLELVMRERDVLRQANKKKMRAIINKTETLNRLVEFIKQKQRRSINGNI